MNLTRVTAPLSVYFDRSAIPAGVLEAAAARGSAVHAACAAYAKGLPIIVQNGAVPFFASFRAWFDRYVERALFVEAEFSDTTTYLITGHPDLVAELTDGRVVVVDYKTPAAESSAWRAQVAAYCYLCKPIVGPCDGMALMLDRDGGPARGIAYKNQAIDFANYLAALQAWRAFGNS